MANKHSTLTDLFSDIANAIREKTGGSATIVADDFPNAIASISTGPSIPALNDASWSMISELSQAGLASSCWSVGDCKKIVLNGTVGTLEFSGYETYVYIIGFDHNGATNTIDFGTFKTAVSGGKDMALADSKYNGTSTNGTKYFNMNHWGNYNYGGWKGCDLRYDVLGSTDVAPSGYGSAATTSRVGYDASETCATNPVSGTLMAALPSELRAVMKPMTVYTDNTGGTTAVASGVTSSVDYLPLLSSYETFGVNAVEADYQTMYAYYAIGNSRLKVRQNDIDGYSIYYFLRTPYYNGYNASYFTVVYPVEAVSTTNGGARFSYGIAPIFRV